MDSRVGERFELAALGERELTPRQRQVLDLIVEGKTNGEIGAALGMTLDGAKWNVSEILAKLGLACREDAAEYWRWRKRRVRRFASAARGLFVAPVLKIAAGGATAVAAVTVVAGALFAMQGVGANEEGEGFVAAEVTPPAMDGAAPESHPGIVEFEAVGVSASPPGQGSGQQRTLRAWHAAGGMLRCVDTVELTLATAAGPVADTVTNTTVVRDGIEKRLGTHSLRSGSGGQPAANPAGGTWSEYADDPLPECTGGVITLVPLGASLGDLQAALRQRYGDGTVFVDEGRATVLDRDVTVFSFSWEGTGVPGPGMPEFNTGTARTWFDTELGLVLKEERASTSGHSDSYKVTRLALGGEMDDSLFVLEQPVGAHVAPPPFAPTRTFTMPDGSTTEHTVIRTPGLYAPIGQPGEWTLIGADASPAPPEYIGGVTFPYTFGFRLGPSPSGATAWLTQEKPDPGLASAFEGAPTVVVDGYDVPFATDTDGVTYLSWLLPGGVRVTGTLWGVTADEFAALFPDLFAIQ